ncbi:MAG TPA: hypothetical protein VNG33_13280 [Polyangiaceae bacterium]|nr:hypothetical protein [Polyangiaceae bacterium]
MECAEIRRGFLAGRVPAGPELDAHLKACPSCAELFENGAALGSRLAQAALPEPPPGDLFALIERDVKAEVGLRARLRALPTRVRAAGLIGVAGSLALYQLLHRRPDYSSAALGGIGAVFGLAIVLSSLQLLRGASTPLGAHARQRRAAVQWLLVPALLTLLMPLGSSSPVWLSAWGSPSACFSYGAILAAPLPLLYWLFERRDDVPVAALVAAGALAGLAANLLLFVHCPSAHLGHLLVGHASIGVAWALALGLLSKSLQRSR